MSHPFGVGNSAFRTGSSAQEVDTVPFGCFPIRVFQRIGLFDERLWRNQDFELNQRIRRTGDGLCKARQSEQRLHQPCDTARVAAPGLGKWLLECHDALPAPGEFLFPPCLSRPVHVGGRLRSGHGNMAGMRATADLAAAARAARLDRRTALHDSTLPTTVNMSRQHGASLWRYWLLIFPTFHWTYGAGVLWGWLRALAHRYPWLPGDTMPRSGGLSGEEWGVSSGEWLVVSGE